MMKEFKNILGASLIALTFSFTLPQVVQAETSCVIPPSCSALGYTKTESDCQGMSILRCPFEQSNVFCVTAAEVPGGGSCKIANVGDILFSDKSCGSVAVDGKRPIGVIFEADRRLAVALNESSKYWSTEYLDVSGLPNITNTNEVLADYNGKNNTKTIMTYCIANSKSCPAAEYAYGYTTVGTHAGDWYLPAAGELNAIYGNKGVLNAAISKTGGTQLSTSSYYWSSSEYDSYSAWNQRFSDGTLSYNSNFKNNSNSVRPVLAF